MSRFEFDLSDADRDRLADRIAARLGPRLEPGRDGVDGPILRRLVKALSTPAPVVQIGALEVAARAGAVLRERDGPGRHVALQGVTADA
jgi:hypothetical protein